VLLLLGVIVGGGLLDGFFELSGGELCGILAILLLLHGLPLSALLLQELVRGGQSLLLGLSVVGLALLLEFLLQPSRLLRLVNPELNCCSARSCSRSSCLCCSCMRRASSSTRRCRSRCSC
jgi:hypothetical protein